MERREPTFNAGVETSGNSSESSDHARRQTSQVDRQPPKTSSGSSGSSGLAVTALVLALAAGGGAGFLGWQLFQAQQALAASNQRITALEEQLNVSAEGTSQSVASLGAKLTKLNDTLNKQADGIEGNRKSLVASVEKMTAQAKEIAAVKQSTSETKNAMTALKQEVAGNKSLSDASLAKLEPVVTQFDQKLDALNEDINKLELEMGNIDAIDRRLKASEEAIKAIDDFRRTTNREILQLKQQVGTAPAPK
jgi:chromosome segregation ATPase